MALGIIDAVCQIFGPSRKQYTLRKKKLLDRSHRILTLLAFAPTVVSHNSLLGYEPRPFLPIRCQSTARSANR
jgi:hypothetical protein